MAVVPGRYQNNLRVARDRCGMTQQQVADSIGVTLTAYQNYEYGRRDMRASVLSDLADALGCSVDYILGIDPEPSHLPTAPKERRMLPVATHETKIGSDNRPIDCQRRREVTNDLYHSHAESWWLLVSTHSMDRIFPPGTMVLVDPELAPRSGDIAAVLLDRSEEPILRRVLYRGDKVLLRAESHDYDIPDTLALPDEVRMLGRVVSFSAPESWSS